MWTALLRQRTVLTQCGPVEADSAHHSPKWTTTCSHSTLNNENTHTVFCCTIWERSTDWNVKYLIDDPAAAIISLKNFYDQWEYTSHRGVKCGRWLLFLLLMLCVIVYACAWLSQYMYSIIPYVCRLFHPMRLQHSQELTCQVSLAQRLFLFNQIAAWMSANKPGIPVWQPQLKLCMYVAQHVVYISAKRAMRPL